MPSPRTNVKIFRCVLEKSLALFDSYERSSGQHHFTVLQRSLGFGRYAGVAARPELSLLGTDCYRLRLDRRIGRFDSTGAANPFPPNCFLRIQSAPGDELGHAGGAIRVRNFPQRRRDAAERKLAAT